MRAAEVTRWAIVVALTPVALPFALLLAGLLLPPAVGLVLLSRSARTHEAESSSDISSLAASSQPDGPFPSLPPGSPGEAEDVNDAASLVSDRPSSPASRRSSSRSVSPSTVSQDLSLRWASSASTSSIHPGSPKSTSSFSSRANLRDCRLLSSPVATNARLLLLRVSLQHTKNAAPGDHIAIQPQNPPSEVESVLRRLHMLDHADHFLRVDSRKRRKRRKDTYANTDDATLPAFVTPREMLLCYREIHGPFRRSMLRELAKHCSDPKDRNALLSMSSPSGSEQYKSEIRDEAPSLLELLHTFPSCFPSLQGLAQALPPLHWRLYTLCNTQIEEADNDDPAVEFAIEVLRWISPSGALREGVCSTYLDRLCLSGEGELACKYVHTPSMHPPSAVFPVLFVSCGLGVAPFRGHLYYREQSKVTNGSLGEAMLIAEQLSSTEGSVPFLEELEKLADNVLRRLVCTSAAEDAIELYAEKVTEMLLMDGVHVMVSGFDSHEAKLVHLALASALKQVRGLRGDQAEEYLTFLQDDQRLVYDSPWVTTSSRVSVHGCNTQSNDAAS